MIRFVQGNFFDYKADIRINTVNCVGVMGAGVALLFKNKYPEMNTEYVKLCNQGLIRPGRPHVWKSKNLFSESSEDIVIINFPTKDDWKKPSEYSYIIDGLKWLNIYLQDKPNSIITIPALGCGHGGLDWEKVKEMIIDNLSGLETEILVFEPKSSHISNIYSSEQDIEILKNKDIKHIIPSDFDYPIQLKGKFSTDLYIKGDVNILTKKTISLIINNKAEEREFSALIKCIDRFEDTNVIFVLSLNSSTDSDLLKELITKKKRVIVIIPTGILQLKLRKDIKNIWDNNLITIVSIFPPNQTWKKYSNIQTLKFALSISKVLLINTMQIDYLKSIQKELVKHNCKFYINYWNDRNTFFESIHAIPVGRDSSTGLPNVRKIELI